MLNIAVYEPEERYDATSPDYDGLWKKLIAQLFEEFVLFVAPELHKAIDFSREHDFLQQELFKSIIRGKKGKRVADQIVKVYLKNGGDQWILIHVEVQGDGLDDFERRMFQYFYRIYDKYEQQVCAIALITSEAKDPPDAFRYSFFGTELQYKYNVFLRPNRIRKPWNVPAILLPWPCWPGFMPIRPRMMWKDVTGLNVNC